MFTKEQLEYLETNLAQSHYLISPNHQAQKRLANEIP